MYVALAIAAAKAYASIQEGNQRAAQEMSAAQTATTNARISAQTAASDLAAADMEVQTTRRQGRARTAEQFAAFAESGFDPSTGSAALSMQQSNMNLELDAATVRYKGELKSRAHAVESQQFAYESKVHSANASAAKKAGYLGAATSVLSSYATMGIT
jgi:hypothetical protein